VSTRHSGYLISVMCYPLKGFPGENLSAVDLTKGCGLPKDRGWAIHNGMMDVTPNGEWTPCQAFVRMTRDENLPLYRWQQNEAGKHCLVHPDGQKIEVEEGPKASRSLLKWFGHINSQFVRTKEGSGYWDHRDAAISLINLTSVKALSRAAGVELDPARFRGNLMIEMSEPWAEFSLIGRRLHIGGVVLEVLRPIDRCKATSVDPQTGAADINLPHLLASHYGHIFCGVYARVVKSGRIDTGDEISETGVAPAALKDAASFATAPSVQNWPRAMRVIERKKESDEVTSFWLEDSLAQLITDIAPASYLRLHVEGECGPLSRSYTLSGWSPDRTRMRISVKREPHPGALSRWLHSSLHRGDTIITSGPFVDPSLEWRARINSDQPVLILTGGIGITVATSVLKTLVNSGSTAAIHIAHAARNADVLALWDDVEALIEQLDNARSFLYLNDNPEKNPKVRPGRLDLNHVTRDLDRENTQVFLCGPAGFMAAMRTELIARGINERRIHEDIFASPVQAPPQQKSPSCAGPLVVRFSDASIDAVWTRETGTLLDLADETGLNLPANCRSGACRECLQPVDGPVENLTEPVSPAPKGWAYLCCAAPSATLKVG